MPITSAPTLIPPNRCNLSRPPTMVHRAPTCANTMAVYRHAGRIKVLFESSSLEPSRRRTRVRAPGDPLREGLRPKIHQHEAELCVPERSLYALILTLRFRIATLPASFSTCFGHVISPPVLTVPMPPLPPVQPRPAPRSSSSSHSDSYGDCDRDLLYDPDAKGEISLATFNKPVSRKKTAKGTRSNRQSTVGSPIAAPIPEGSPVVRSYSDGPPRSTRSASLHGHGSGSEHGQDRPPPPPPPLPSPMPTTVTASGIPISAPSTKTARGSAEARSSRSNSVSSMMSMASKRTAAIQDLAASSTVIGGRSQIELFPVDALLIFDVHSLCLHLRRALGFVFAIREAMWDELAALVTAAPSPGGRGSGSDVDLTKYGFFPHEDTLQSMRSKYVQLLDQYKQCVLRTRSLGHALD